jgi:uncharacterized protein
MASDRSDPGAGIGLRLAHIEEMLSTRPPSLGLLEVHAENYMSGSPAIVALDDLRRDYALSLHGVGLSLGGAAEPHRTHLARLKALTERLEPDLISEHLAWSVHAGAYFNDLLPLPYTEESLRIVCCNVDRAQDALGRRLLIENPAVYLRFRHATIDEPIFLAELAARTGCGILCDVNNLYVNWRNFGPDPIAYMDALPRDAVGEFHLAGHHESDADGHTILIDDHGAPVAEPVWALYEHGVRRFGRCATIVERDTNLPPLGALISEAGRATQIAQRVVERSKPVAFA